MIPLKEHTITWTEIENKEYEARATGLADFGLLLLRKMTETQGKGAQRRLKMDTLLQVSEDEMDRLYYASPDRKSVYMMKLYQGPRPMTNELCQRYGWRFGPGQYSLWKMTAKEYGMPIVPHVENNPATPPLE